VGAGMHAGWGVSAGSGSMSQGPWTGLLGPAELVTPTAASDLYKKHKGSKNLGGGHEWRAAAAAAIMGRVSVLQDGVLWGTLGM
jgi:hypothetical protein